MRVMRVMRVMRAGRRRRPARGRVGVATAVTAVGVLVAGCASGSEPPGGGAPPSAVVGTATRAVVGTTTGPPAPPPLSGCCHAWTAEATQEISPAYRQGVARHGEDWIWSFNTALFRTSGDDLRESLQVAQAIPADLVAEGYNHLGDIDVDTATGMLWAPLEREDKAGGEQRMAAYDAASARFIGSFEVAQHHASFVAVDATRRIAYSQDRFGGDALLR